MPVKGKNSFGIPYQRTGLPLVDSVIWRILDALDQLRIQTTPSATASTGPGGTLVTARAGALVRFAPSLTPFTLYNASEGSTLKVGIIPGLANLISPTLTGASPSGTLAANPPPLLTITATRYFWLKCVGTFGANDTYVVTVESNGTGTVPAAEAISGTGFTSYLYLGDVTVASGAITAVNSALRSNLGVESYGNVNNWWALA